MRGSSRLNSLRLSLAAGVHAAWSPRFTCRLTSPCVSVTNACSEGDASAYHQTEAPGFVRLNALLLKLRTAVRDSALGSASTKTGRTKLVVANRVGAASSLVAVSRAGGFNQACGFAMLLAGIRIFDELK